MTIPIPTQDEMESFFDMLTRLRADSRMIQIMIEHHLAIQPIVEEDGTIEWVVCQEDLPSLAKREEFIDTNVVASDPDLRKALHIADRVLQEQKRAAAKP